MKLYVIPVQETCNAKCTFCITRYRRETGFGDQIAEEDLGKLAAVHPDKIEITGGGEPLLHLGIEKIIAKAAEIAPTQMYTNGQLLMRLGEESLRRLATLCISRSHYDDEVNLQIMKVKYDSQRIRAASRLVKVKLSLVLTKSGIANEKDLLKYVSWGKRAMGASSIVVRQMFDFDYPKEVAGELVATARVFEKLKDKYPLRGEINENPVLEIAGVKVEFEGRSCACQSDNLVLRPNGIIYQGWGKDVYRDD